MIVSMPSDIVQCKSDFISNQSIACRKHAVKIVFAFCPPIRPIAHATIPNTLSSSLLAKRLHEVPEDIPGSRLFPIALATFIFHRQMIRVRHVEHVRPDFTVKICSVHLQQLIKPEIIHHAGHFLIKRQFLGQPRRIPGTHILTMIASIHPQIPWVPEAPWA